MNGDHRENSELDITIRIPGAPEQVVNVVDAALDSPDIARHFYDEHMKSRFLVEFAVSDLDAPLDQATLRIVAGGGSTLIVDIGRILDSRIPDAPERQRIRNLVARFESVGNNCELGILQRQVGVDRMSLLRFGASLDARTLARAIRDEFDGFAGPEDLEMSLYGSEWIATSRKYGFEVHTWKHTHEMTEDTIREQESRKLRFQASMFLETLEEGKKILVRRDPVDEGYATEDAIRELHSAIRARGQCALIWISGKSASEGAPRFERLASGLFRAPNPGLAPFKWVSDLGLKGWMAFLEGAEATVRGDADLPRENVGGMLAQERQIFVGDQAFRPVSSDQVEPAPRPSSWLPLLGRFGLARKRPESAVGLPDE